MKIQFVGPFFTSDTSSYARVNKGLALALNKLKDIEVVAHQHKERIDKYPEKNDLETQSELGKIWKDSYEEDADITIYHDFPKGGFVKHDLQNLPGKIKLMYIFWEESVYPEMWVKEINENLHGVLAGSSFVKEVLMDAGVSVPIEVISSGLDESIKEQRETYALDTQKSCKFLHISTAKARKGVDVLLDAYKQEFSNQDDVVLVLKTGFSPDDRVEELIKQFGEKGSPEVLHIKEILSDKEIYDLVNSSDIAVYPSRAEGFGLPIAESMYLEKPVIATNYSAQLDFMSEENAWPIQFSMSKVTGSEFGLVGSYWAEPDVVDLREKMRYLYENRDSEEVRVKVSKAKQIANELTWENVAKRCVQFLEEIRSFAHLKEEKLAVITPFNAQDGIAEHSELLYKHIESSFKETYYISNTDTTDKVRKDNEHVVRLWKTGEITFSDTISYITEQNIKYVHIQYHSGFHYPVEGLDTLITKLKELDIKVFLTLHQVKGKGFNIPKESKKLEIVDKVIVHNKEEFNELYKDYKNIVFSTLPRISAKKRNKEMLKKDLDLEQYSPFLVTHGLLTQKNNLPSIIEAIDMLRPKHPNIHLLALNAVSANNSASGAELKKAKVVVDEKGLQEHVTFITDFLDAEVVEVLLQSADIGILAYSDVGESGSAAIGKFLASGNPTVVTNIPQFAEFAKELLKIPDEHPKSIAAGIETLVRDKSLRNRIVLSAKTYIKNNAYDVKAREHLEMYVLHTNK